MNTGKLLFVPSGGLANRMRAMASAWQLAVNTGVKVETIWFCDWALNAPFHSIFEPIDNVEMMAREAKAWELLTLDRPRKRNFRIPLLYQRLRFAQRIDEWQVTPLKNQGFNFNEWARGKNSYMSCYQDFGNVPNSVYKHLFHPVGPVLDEIQSYREHFSAHTIGMHIGVQTIRSRLNEVRLVYLSMPHDAKLTNTMTRAYFLQPTMRLPRRH